MSYRTVSSTRPYGDEWVQVKCDDCGELGPRVEVTLPRRRVDIPREVSTLARLAAGTVERTKPGRTKSGRSAKWWTVDDLCRSCAFKAAALRLIERAGGPFDRPLPDADGNLPDVNA